MANRITTLVVDCTEPARLAGFWCQVLGYEVLDPGCEDELDGSVEISPPGQPAKGPMPTLLFQPVADPTPASGGCTWT